MITPRPHAVVSALILGLAAAALGTLTASSHAAAPGPGPGPILAVGAENEYANVLAQIGGRYVRVSAIETNPSIDPHTFEASPGVARLVGGAQIVVQNGLGYDEFMNRIESASPSRSRRVIDMQALLHLPDSTANPHLWYRPDAMPALAKAVASALAALEPRNAASFRANASRFVRSLNPWFQALHAFSVRFPRAPVATTEPVADYMLAAAGAANLTPTTFQDDVMNGVDPAPQDVAIEESLLSRHRVRAFLYNAQVTDSLTRTILADATRNHVPVVAVYETMPSGYDYQSWMLAEVGALQKAVAKRISTTRL